MTWDAIVESEQAAENMHWIEFACSCDLASDEFIALS
jgi:hypothetical protein